MMLPVSITVANLPKATDRLKIPVPTPQFREETYEEWCARYHKARRDRINQLSTSITSIDGPITLSREARELIAEVFQEYLRKDV